MSHARGLDLQNGLARLLQVRGWPHAQSAGAGRPGTDVLGTPGIVWENKTAGAFNAFAWAKQAAGHARNGEVPVCVYWPRGVGEKRPELALGIVPLTVLTRLLTAAGYGTDIGGQS